MPFIIAGGALLGGYLSSQSNERAAGTSANAQLASSREAAQAQLEAARLGAEAAKFRPVGVTTRYGSSNFQFNPSGYLTGAGYTVSPELQAYQNQLQGLTRGALAQAQLAPQQYAPLQQSAQGLFGLGQQYLAKSPQDVAAQYIQQQQDLLAPSRERQLSQLQNTLYQQGRGGLSVGATGTRPSGAVGLGATTPEMEAYYNALAQQDAQLAAQAQQAGQQNVAFGTGLLNQGAGLLGQYQAGQVNALNPFTTYLGAGQTIESMGQQPLDIGAQLGGRSATAGANVGQALLSGGLNAGRSILEGGINAARAQQLGASGSGFGSFLTGLGGNQQFTQGLQNVYGNFQLNRNLQNAIPQGTAFNPMSSSDLEALINGTAFG
jgi:hypothetical protein